MTELSGTGKCASEERSDIQNGIKEKRMASVPMLRLDPLSILNSWDKMGGCYIEEHSMFDEIDAAMARDLGDFECPSNERWTANAPSFTEEKGCLEAFNPLLPPQPDGLLSDPDFVFPDISFPIHNSTSTELPPANGPYPDLAAQTRAFDSFFNCEEPGLEEIKALFSSDACAGSIKSELVHSSSQGSFESECVVPNTSQAEHSNTTGMDCDSYGTVPDLMADLSWTTSKSVGDVKTEPLSKAATGFNYDSPIPLLASLGASLLFNYQGYDLKSRARMEGLERYRSKKAQRMFTKKIRYQLRKINADKRPRIKGRFVKKDFTSEPSFPASITDQLSVDSDMEDQDIDPFNF
eukprot:gene14685-20722_t